MYVDLIQYPTCISWVSTEQLTFVKNTNIPRKQIEMLDAIRSREIGIFYPGTEHDYLLRTLSGSDTFSASTSGKGVLFAFQGDALVGYVVITRKDNQRFKLGPIWVDRSSRARGIGTRMVNATVGSLGGGHVYLTVPEENLPMVATVEKCGFQRDAAIPDLYRVGRLEFVYSRGLSEPCRDLSVYRMEARLLKSISRKAIFQLALDETTDICFEIKRGGAIKMLVDKYSSKQTTLNLSLRSRNFVYCIVNLHRDRVGQLCPFIHETFSIGRKTLCIFRPW